MGRRAQPGVTVLPKAICAGGGPDVVLGRGQRWFESTHRDIVHSGARERRGVHSQE